MPDTAPNAELLRSLGRLVRGLSALFWGMPVALVVCFYTTMRAETLRPFGVIPPLAVTGLLVYGLWQIGGFQKQERIWRNALDRARLVALVNFGLSPFLYWWNRVPGQGFFTAMVVLLAFCGLLFLACLNLVLQRLGAILPDEALRQETKQFGMLNLNLLAGTVVAMAAYFSLGHVAKLPLWLGVIGEVLERGGFWFLIVLVLLPLAMTMALLWKTKEVILDSIFRAKG